MKRVRFCSCVILASLFLSAALFAETHRVLYQKPGAPVRLVAPSLGELDQGDVIALKYRFLTPSRDGVARIRVEVDQGLEHDAQNVYDFNLSSGIPEISFEATSNSNGVYYVRFVVELNDQMRALGHKIQIGEPAAELRYKSKQVTGGIRTMPADESVRQK